MGLTASKLKRRSLSPTARGRTMHTNENGKDSTRYPHAAPFATTKNLHLFKIYKYIHQNSKLVRSIHDVLLD